MMETQNTYELKVKRRLRTGYIIFGTLVGIKITEYLISLVILSGDWPYLALLALMSAWLIIYYYKHVSELWNSERKEDE